MKFKNRTKIVVGFILLALIAVFSVIVIEKRKTSISQLKILPDKVDLQIKNVRYTDVAESGMKWEINADTARYIKKENIAIFEKVSIKLITEDGKIFLMSGKEGNLKTDTKDMKVSGNVKIISNSGDSFTTDNLNYSNSEKRFYTDSSVVIENPRMKIRGNGMSLSLKDEKLALLSGVKAEINK
jgi:LPS export ABC transporter protein LptC